MQLNKLIKERRIELGLTDRNLAKLAGLSIHEYADIEDDPTEAITVLPLKDLRNICTVLRLNLSTLLRCAEILNDENSNNTLELMPLNELIKKQRETLGLTMDELGDKIGFYEQAILDMESSCDYLEGWSIDLICHLCTELRIPLSVVINR